LIALLFIIFSIVISMLLNNDYSSANFILMMKVVSAFLITFVISKDEFIESYIKAMLIICILSLICYITYFIFGPLLSSHFPIVYYGDDETKAYVNLYFAFFKLTYGLPRNIGIFREPGVYQFFINTALLFELFFLKKKQNIFIVAIFIITLLTTFSTAGVPVGLLILFLYLFNKNRAIINKIQITAVFLILLVIGMKIVDSNPEIANRFEEMATKAETDKTSYEVRYESIFNNIKASAVKPIFGLGVNNGLIYIQDNFIQYGTKDITGTFLIFIPILGYPLGFFLFYLLWYAMANLAGTSNKIFIFFYFIIFFIAAISQNLIFDDFIWVILFASFIREK